MRSLRFCSKYIEEANLVPKKPSYLTIDGIHPWAAWIAIETGAHRETNEHIDIDCMRLGDFCPTLWDLESVSQLRLLSMNRQDKSLLDKL